MRDVVARDSEYLPIARRFSAITREAMRQTSLPRSFRSRTNADAIRGDVGL